MPYNSQTTPVMTKHITDLGDFLTRAQIRECEKLLARGDGARSAASAICENVIRPNIEAINRKLGQENDPLYLAYLVEYAISTVKGRS